jgi:hypothetical protein
MYDLSFARCKSFWWIILKDGDSRGGANLSATRTSLFNYFHSRLWLLVIPKSEARVSLAPIKDSFSSIPSEGFDFTVRFFHTEFIERSQLNFFYPRKIFLFLDAWFSNQISLRIILNIHLEYCNPVSPVTTSLQTLHMNNNNIYNWKQFLWILISNVILHERSQHF